MFDALFNSKLLTLIVINLIYYFLEKLYLLINIEDKPWIPKIHKDTIYSFGGVIFFIKRIVYFYRILLNNNSLFFNKEIFRDIGFIVFIIINVFYWLIR